MKASAVAVARLVVARDLRLAFRKPSQLLQPLLFFMIVATLFPLTLTPDLSRLRDAASPAAIVLASSREQADFGTLVAESGARGLIDKSLLSGDAVRALVT